ncbi:integrin alpha-PS5-like [Drosophila teissieri]|uniref:integrin alpha-PS5-like n=1 Tax=Drosophila teissieri TaxID=7243 RepID=UPI001CBA5887|nr:integrin alpha-PS5-like [Drosophila teissieri]
MYRLLILIFLAMKYQSEAFNFSPFPNLVINAPKHLKTQLSQTRSSYFGYSLVIRPTSIFVGAPRAQSTLGSQSTINETGAVFRCSLANGSCRPYVLDVTGNMRPYYSPHYSHGKDFQWLGGSMDGGTKDTDKLLVCAPRFFVYPNVTQGHMLGACYWVRDTVADTPPLSEVNSISSLDWYNVSSTEMPELGFSAHVTDDNSEMLSGAVGVGSWNGSLVLHKRKKISTRIRQKGDVVMPQSYESKKLKLDYLHQKSLFYFGYAVSSGYFSKYNRKKLLYVATAPHSNVKFGEAHILDVQEERIFQDYVLQGEQLGEYFGYSVVADDFNGDGLTDLVVSAPLNALGDYHDVGAIYVFINEGLFYFKKTIIRLSLGSNARFGTSLSRLGDINHDGYNDLAVAAPFEGNGAVFIFLGSQHGLPDQPSQRLDAPLREPCPYGAHMFGHGLSRGSDIDGNGFNDLAIGAPGAEAVYLYRTYPVAKIHATLKSETQEIKPERDVVTVTACYRLNTTSQSMQVQHQQLTIRIVIDEVLKRVKFAPMNTSEVTIHPEAELNERCWEFQVQVRYTGAILSPIDLQMHYELAKKIPVSQQAFCETCAVVDPMDPTYTTEKIYFNTGCAGDVCVSDLHLSTKDVDSSFTLGTNESLSLTYEITNSGEPAYVAQLNVTSSARLPFSKVPGNCRVREEVILCDLNGQRAMTKGDSESLTITFDVTQLRGHSLTIEAAVSSAGIDKNPKDNRLSTLISLKEYAEIDASGGPADGQLVLREYPYSAEVSNSYEIKSHGPSILDELSLFVYIPIAYRTAESAVIKPIFNLSSLQMQATHGARLLPIKLYDQDNTLAMEYPLKDASHSEEIESSENRKRRELKQDQYAITPDVESKDLLTQEDPSVSRTLVLNCQSSNLTICVRAEMQLQLKPDQPINLNISFNVDLSAVTDPFEYFVIFTDLKLSTKRDPKSSLIAIKRNIKPNVILKYSETPLPIWYIILALIAGLLLLASLTYVLYKLGFFKRAKKEELQRLKEESPTREESEEDREDSQEENCLERQSYSDN